MDANSVRALSEEKQVREFKSNRRWGALFWIMPLGLASGSFGLGPVIGSIVTIVLLILCIPFKIRKIMYFIFSGLLIALGFLGGLGGIILSVIICLAYIGICYSNYEYVKQANEINEYERKISN